MNDYTHALPVRIRIGDRREWTLGDVPATPDGRVHPAALAELITAVGLYMHDVIDNQISGAHGKVDDDWQQWGNESEETA